MSLTNIDIETTGSETAIFTGDLVHVLFDYAPNLSEFRGLDKVTFRSSTAAYFRKFPGVFDLSRY